MFIYPFNCRKEWEIIEREMKEEESGMGPVR